MQLSLKDPRTQITTRGGKELRSSRTYSSRKGLVGYRSRALHLTFPWSSQPVEVHSRFDLDPRQYRYLQWCWEHKGPRFLALLGFQTYRQARYTINLVRKTKWH